MAPPPEEAACPPPPLAATGLGAGAGAGVGAGAGAFLAPPPKKPPSPPPSFLAHGRERGRSRSRHGFRHHLARPLHTGSSLLCGSSFSHSSLLCLYLVLLACAAAALASAAALFLSSAACFFAAAATLCSCSSGSILLRLDGCLLFCLGQLLSPSRYLSRSLLRGSLSNSGCSLLVRAAFRCLLLCCLLLSSISLCLLPLQLCCLAASPDVHACPQVWLLWHGPALHAWQTGLLASLGLAASAPCGHAPARQACSCCRPLDLCCLLLRLRRRQPRQPRQGQAWTAWGA